jgi:hypothetical protein
MRVKTFKFYRTRLAEDAPANAAGTGGIAGLGIGPKGEPGVDLRKRKKDIKKQAQDAGLAEGTLKEFADYGPPPAGHQTTGYPNDPELASAILDLMRRREGQKKDRKDIDWEEMNTQVVEALAPADTFAGVPVFEVDMDRVMKARFAKHPSHRYSRYVGEDEMGEAIRQHGRTKGGDIILKDAVTSVMTYLKRKKPAQ